MTKILKIIFLTFLLTSCGFQRMDTVGGMNFYVENINFLGDKKSGYIISNSIMPYSNPSSQNKINLNLNVSREKVAKEKNISNKITKFTLIMNVEIESYISSSSEIKKNNFTHSLDYEVAKNHSNTIAKEKSIVENISNIVGEKIVRYLRSEYN